MSLAVSLHAIATAGVNGRTWDHDAGFHAWWVEEGVLAGEYPGDCHDDRAREKVNLLIDAGVRTFIDLTTPADHLKPYRVHLDAAARNRQIALHHEPFPIPDLDIVADGQYATVLDIIATHRAEGAVYVHCWGGVGRTGTVIGAYLAAQGLGYEAILERLQSLRAGTRKSHRPAPETKPQRDLLRRLAISPRR